MVRKMTLNLFNRIILWLKKIFHIYPKAEYKRRPVEVTPQPEEKSIKDAPPEEKTREVSQDEKKPVDMLLPEKKTTKVTPLPEHKPPETPSEKEPQEPSVEETLTTEPQIKYPEEKAKTEEKDAPEPRKPYKKKSPTEERKEEPSTVKRKPSSPEQREPIYLGSTQRRRRWLTGAHPKSPSDEKIETEIVDKVPEEKEFATTVESPYVEINLDNAEVYLILPKQQFKANTVDETPQQTSYSIDLNGKQQEVIVRITTNRGGLMFVEEKRILLEEPLVKFQVAFPDEIQKGEYNYNHNDKGLYAFVAIGNNRGRMYYLSDKEGNINPLPQRVNWVLVHEEFELQTVLGPSDITEDIWIWERYQPFRIDLSEIDALVIKNKISGEEKSFALQSTYRVEGEQVIEDDYKKECPLFTGKILKIVAPYENQSGWSVWIQNKAAGYKIKENWTGREPLTLRLPDDLPSEFGEFQIDICQQNTRILEETIFFRWMPSIELNYPKELIIPDLKSGHASSIISVKLDSNVGWGLKADGSEQSESIYGKCHQLELPPEKDTIRFSIAETNRPEITVNFQITIPRLKWKTSKQMTWNGISQKIERRHLEPGYPLYLQIRTNDFDNKYDLLALLEANGQKLQEGKFIRKGLEYSLELNQFYDTIKQNKDELSLKVKIQSEKHNHLIDEVYILEFTPPIIRCKDISCNYKTHCREEILSHFEKYHLRNLVEHLSYEEIREYYKSLPYKIYNCAYCSFYSREDDPRNPTSIICWHIENKCPKVDHEKGPLKISFRVVDDIDEIRQNVFPSLSHIYKCKLCGMHFKDYNNKAKVEHFFSKHENKICEYLER
ncbi:MAG: hypothetical protein H8E13_14395 [Actinobacteria bacterium]|nr:hypothetical protein [Actinomycetota bacterium]